MGSLLWECNWGNINKGQCQRSLAYNKQFSVGMCAYVPGPVYIHKHMSFNRC